MTRRGKRSWQKKKEKTPKYRGGIEIRPCADFASSSRALPPGVDIASSSRTLPPKHNGSTSQGGVRISSSGTLPQVKEEDEDNSGPEPEELLGAKCTKKKAPPLDAIARLPKIPKVSRMHEWSVEEYGKYDAYLIKKWSFFGFQEKDRGYVSTRDGNSKIAWTFRKFYKNS